MIRSVLRPQGHATTPVLLANDAGGKKARVNGVNGFTGDFNQDFFMMYPDPASVQGGNSEAYQFLYQFFSKNKGQQRILLSDLGIPTPKTYLEPSAGTNRFVKRPLRHQGSQGYSVVTGGMPSFVEGEEYLSEFFPKEREYRIVYVYGSPVLAIRKKPKEGVTKEMPWGNTNATWQKINLEECLLKTQTDCITKLNNCPVLRHAHIVAVDILYNSSCNPKYSVLEFNTCPDLQVNSYRQIVAEAIVNH